MNNKSDLKKDCLDYLAIYNGNDKFTKDKIEMEDYIDKQIVLIGPTKTGKTFLLTSLLYEFNKSVKFSNAFVIAPINSQKFYEPIVNSKFIFSTESSDKCSKIREIIKFQDDSISMWNKTFKEDELLKFINRLGLKDFYDKLILISQKFYKDNLGKIKLKSVEERVRLTLRKKIFNYCTNENSNWKKKLGNSYNELNDNKFVLMCQYPLNRPPRMLLILDDCGDQIKDWIKTKELNIDFGNNSGGDILTSTAIKGRHSYITIIYCIQRLKHLPPSIRSQTKVFCICNYSPIDEIASETGCKKLKNHIVSKTFEKVTDPITNAKNNKVIYNVDLDQYVEVLARKTPEFHIGVKPERVESKIAKLINSNP